MIGPKDDPMATGGALGPDARALLDAARAGLSPDAAAMRRVHAGIHGAVSAGAATGTALAAKLGIVAIVAMVAAGAALYFRHGAAPAPGRAQPRAAEPTAATRVALSSDAVDPDLITIETAPASSAPAGPAAGTSAPVSPPLYHRAAPARSAATVASGAARAEAALGAAPASRPAPGASPKLPARLSSRAAPGPIIELGREVELVDRAMAALRRGAPDEALRVVRVYAAEAGDHGQLTQDAEAIAVEALCRLGDPGAGARLAQFALRFPRSAQRARLAAACK